MFVKTMKRMCCAFILLGVISGCGGPGTDPDYSSDLNSAEYTLEKIVPLAETADRTFEINFKEYDDYDKYLIVLYGINSDDLEHEYSYLIWSDDFDPSSLGRAAMDKRQTEKTYDFENNGLKRPIVKLDKAIIDPVIGDVADFKVVTDISDLTTHVNAMLRYSDDNIYVYVDEGDSNEISDHELNEAFDQFSNIIDDMRSLYGMESDIDENGHLVVLVSSKGVLTYSASGYFSPDDMLPTSEKSNSNEMEVIFASSELFDSSSSVNHMAITTLAHEYQHLIEWNRHFPGEVYEAADGLSYIQEGLAHTARDIYSIKDNYMSSVSTVNANLISKYISRTSKTCFMCKSGDSVDIDRQGGMYLFLRYLYEQAQAGRFEGVKDGAEFIQNIMQNPLTGIESIIKSVYTDASDEEFEQLFGDLLGDYALALLLSDYVVDNDPKYQFNGIKLRNSVIEYFADDLEGPYVIKTYLRSLTGKSWDEGLSPSGIAYFELDDKTVSDTHNLKFEFEEGINVGAYLVLLNDVSSD